MLPDKSVHVWTRNVSFGNITEKNGYDFTRHQVNPTSGCGLSTISAFSPEFS